MNNFYLKLQKESEKLGCFVANGTYTPPKNGKIETYNLYVKDLFSYLPPRKRSIEKLIDFAKKRFSFDSVSVKEKGQTTLITFNNLMDLSNKKSLE